jgi:hypothetical protein
VSDPLGPVMITGREIYDAVMRLVGRVDVLIAQHDATVRDQQDHEKATAAAHTDFETRLRSLERRQWPLPTASMLISVGVLIVMIVSYKP